MPEKQLGVLEWICGIVGTALFGCMGYLQTNKVSKSTFETYMEQHKEVHLEQCKKIDDVHKGVERIEGYLMQGGKWDGTERRQHER